jgi:glycosyltransferase involved in cell wall biosynthesis
VKDIERQGARGECEGATGTAARPTFSIVIPAYNAQRTIRAAIESVLAQTRSDFELIIVDDGSTDNTRASVEPYLRDRRVSLISQANRGQSSARNTAIAAAAGTYVSLLDHDDLWLPQYLEVMSDRFRADPSAGVAYTDAWVLDDETRKIARTTVMSAWHPPIAPPNADQFLRALLELGNFVFVAATIRRAVLDDVGPFRIGVEGSEDYELWLRIAARGYRFLRVDLPLAIHRRHPGQPSADRAAMDRAAAEVFRIATEEYGLPDEIRDLAKRRLPMARFPVRSSRRVPHLLRTAYATLSRFRHFHVRPPSAVREAFPDLRSL